MSIDKIFICDLCLLSFNEENCVGIKQFNDQTITCYAPAGDKHVCCLCLDKLKKVDYV